jgi:hypothetical protein
MYLNLNQEKIKKLNAHDFDEFDFLESEVELISEAVTCQKWDHFESITTSSQINGYGSLQTFFLKTRSKKTPFIRCSIYENDCACMPLNFKANPVISEIFLRGKTLE